jgi:hypothetical protein
MLIYLSFEIYQLNSDFQMGIFETFKSVGLDHLLRRAAENESDPSGAVFDAVKGSCLHHGVPKLLEAAAAIDKIVTGDGLDLAMAFSKEFEP